MSTTYTIRQLTKEMGVTSRTLRHYEDEGLLSPARQGQARIYSQRDRGRLMLILRGRRVGFSLAEIREILDLYQGGEDGGAPQLQHTRKKFVERVAALERQRHDIDDAVHELKLGIERIEHQLAEHHGTHVPAAPAPRPAYAASSARN